MEKQTDLSAGAAGPAAPGIVLAVALAIWGGLPISGTAAALLAMAMCNVPMSLLALFLSRGIFAQAELNR